MDTSGAFSMGKREEAIKDACTLAPDARSEEQIQAIVDFLEGPAREIEFLKTLDKFQQRTLCRVMSVQSYEKGDTIFKMGDRGDKYYIILLGSVSVQVPEPTCPTGIHTQRCTCPDRPLQSPFYLQKGSGFGELALQDDAPRAATIITCENADFLTITREHYEQYAGKLHKRFIEQRVNFLRQCPLINDALDEGVVSEQDLAAMANYLNEKSLNGNQVVVRQGDEVQSVIFVRSGSLAMLKLVEVDGKESRRNRANAEAKRNSKEWVRPEVRQTMDASKLAKAIMEMKKQERDNRVKETFLRRRSSNTKGAKEAQAFSTQVLGRRSSVQLQVPDSDDSDSQPDDKPVIAPFPSMATKDESPNATTKPALKLGASKAGKALWGKVRNATNQATVLAKTATVLESLTGAAFTEKAKKEKKKVLLRVGSVGAFQYFGDKEVCNSQVFPCSLMSDPIADIYIMSRHDILRRLPKNLQGVIFTQELQSEPTDGELVDMLRQNERWFTFRRSMHGEVLMCRDQERGSAVRADTSIKRIDAIANFEFLGVNPHGPNAARTLPPPRKTLGVHLTAKDEELFSQTSARFLRRFDNLKRDRGLQKALRKNGAWERLKNGMRNQDGFDPSQVRFEQQWSKLQVQQDHKDPVSLKLEKLEETFRIPEAEEIEELRRKDPEFGGWPDRFASTPGSTLLPGQLDAPGGAAHRTTARWNADTTIELPSLAATSSSAQMAATAQASFGVDRNEL